jgi:hypothetical protein
MDISKERKQVMLILNEKGLVPSLEEVTRPSVAEVEPLRVERLQRSHRPRQIHRPALQREVDVVGHKAEG